MPSKTKSKFIFVVGGVMSSVGKGITVSSMAAILKARGFKVTAMKADPYVNVDAGTMNPTEHGEVFVTEDGDETDQDIGNYERFLDENIYSTNYMTTGRVYQSVIEKERNLAYKGKCVEVVPHVTNEIIRRIELASKKSKADINVIEIGGTLGEYQNILFLEAARIMKHINPDNVLIVLVSYLPIPRKVGEMKTKPTQYASRTLNNAGLQADFIICRSEKPLDDKRKEKISTFCNVPIEAAISAPDVDRIYDVPLNFIKEGLDEKILKKFNLKPKEKDLKELRKFLSKVNKLKKSVKIAIVGKYFGTGKFSLADSYISVIESLKFAAWHNNSNIEIDWLDAEKFEKDKKTLKGLNLYDGILVPGGFGSRGTEGKILAAKYSRENKIPYFGLCLGLQIMTIEFARNVLKLRGANSEELKNNVKDPIIHIIPEQKKLIEENKYGNTMRLGAYKCKLTKDTKSFKAYLNAGWIKEKGSKVISERHRHRYELNNKYRERLEKNGLKVAGVNPSQNLVEILELEKHPFMIGTQFHPEFKSRPLNPHPLFYEFIRAAIKHKGKKT